MINTQNVLVLGGASWNTMVYLDAFPAPTPQTIFDAKFVEGAGSTGIGKSFVLKALGANPLFHFMLGDDEAGGKVLAACNARNIKMIIDQYEGETAQHLNLMDAQGQRISIFKSNGPSDPKIDIERIRPHIEAAKTIYLNLSASCIPLLPAVKKASGTVVVDLHDYDGSNPWYDQFIACADILQISNEQLKNPEKTIAQLLSGRAHTLVLTKGGDGAEIFQTETRLSIEPIVANVKDTNGAGDAFCVAFCQTLANGAALRQAGEFAANIAAQTVSCAEIAPHRYD